MSSPTSLWQGIQIQIPLDFNALSLRYVLLKLAAEDDDFLTCWEQLHFDDGILTCWEQLHFVTTLAKLNPRVLGILDFFVC